MLSIFLLLLPIAECIEFRQNEATCIGPFASVVTVSQYRVCFNTSISTNTTITVNSDASLIVENAPTFLHTTATFTEYITQYITGSKLPTTPAPFNPQIGTSSQQPPAIYSATDFNIPNGITSPEFASPGPGNLPSSNTGQNPSGNANTAPQFSVDFQTISELGAGFVIPESTVKSIVTTIFLQSVVTFTEDGTTFVSTRPESTSIYTIDLVIPATTKTRGSINPSDYVGVAITEYESVITSVITVSFPGVTSTALGPGATIVITQPGSLSYYTKIITIFATTLGDVPQTSLEIPDSQSNSQNAIPGLVLTPTVKSTDPGSQTKTNGGLIFTTLEPTDTTSYTMAVTPPPSLVLPGEDVISVVTSVLPEYTSTSTDQSGNTIVITRPASTTIYTTTFTASSSALAGSSDILSLTSESATTWTNFGEQAGAAGWPGTSGVQVPTLGSPSSIVLGTAIPQPPSYPSYTTSTAYATSIFSTLGSLTTAINPVSTFVITLSEQSYSVSTIFSIHVSDGTTIQQPVSTSIIYPSIYSSSQIITTLYSTIVSEVSGSQMTTLLPFSTFTVTPPESTLSAVVSTIYSTVVTVNSGIPTTIVQPVSTVLVSDPTSTSETTANGNEQVQTSTIYNTVVSGILGSQTTFLQPVSTVVITRTISSSSTTISAPDSSTTFISGNISGPQTTTSQPQSTFNLVSTTSTFGGVSFGTSTAQSSTITSSSDSVITSVSLFPTFLSSSIIYSTTVVSNSGSVTTIVQPISTVVVVSATSISISTAPTGGIVVTSTQASNNPPVQGTTSSQPSASPTVADNIVFLLQPVQNKTINGNQKRQESFDTLPVAEQLFNGHYIDLAKRQNGSDTTPTNDTNYVSSQGIIADPCKPATLFAISSSNLATGGGGYYGAIPGQNYSVFTSTWDPAATIIDKFTITGGILTWANSLFEGGSARFCNTTEGVVIAVYQGLLPSNCTAISLVYQGGGICPPEVTAAQNFDFPATATSTTSELPASTESSSSQISVSNPSGSSTSSASTDPLQQSAATSPTISSSSTEETSSLSSSSSPSQTTSSSGTSSIGLASSDSLSTTSAESSSSSANSSTGSKSSDMSQSLSDSTTTTASSQLSSIASATRTSEDSSTSLLPSSSVRSSSTTDFSGSQSPSVQSTTTRSQVQTTSSIQQSQTTSDIPSSSNSSSSISHSTGNNSQLTSSSSAASSTDLNGSDSYSPVSSTTTGVPSSTTSTLSGAGSTDSGISSTTSSSRALTNSVSVSPNSDSSSSDHTTSTIASDSTVSSASITSSLSATDSSATVLGSTTSTSSRAGSTDLSVSSTVSSSSAPSDSVSVSSSSGSSGSDLITSTIASDSTTSSLPATGSSTTDLGSSTSTSDRSSTPPSSDSSSSDSASFTSTSESTTSTLSSDTLSLDLSTTSSNDLGLTSTTSSDFTTSDTPASTVLSDTSSDPGISLTSSSQGSSTTTPDVTASTDQTSDSTTSSSSYTISSSDDSSSTQLIPTSTTDNLDVNSTSSSDFSVTTTSDTTSSDFTTEATTSSLTSGVSSPDSTSSLTSSTDAILSPTISSTDPLSTTTDASSTSDSSASTSESSSASVTDATTASDSSSSTSESSSDNITDATTTSDLSSSTSESSSDSTTSSITLTDTVSSTSSDSSTTIDGSSTSDSSTSTSDSSSDSITDATTTSELSSSTPESSLDSTTSSITLTETVSSTSSDSSTTIDGSSTSDSSTSTSESSSDSITDVTTTSESSSSTSESSSDSITDTSTTSDSSSSTSESSSDSNTDATATSALSTSTSESSSDSITDTTTTASDLSSSTSESSSDNITGATTTSDPSTSTSESSSDSITDTTTTSDPSTSTSESSSDSITDATTTASDLSSSTSESSSDSTTSSITLTETVSSTSSDSSTTTDFSITSDSSSSTSESSSTELSSTSSETTDIPTSSLTSSDSAQTSDSTTLSFTPTDTVSSTSSDFVTTTTFLDDGQPGFTSTSGFNVLVGYEVPTSTFVTTIDPFSAPYTTTVPASGSTPGTVIIGSPASVSYTTETIYLDNNESPFTSTSGSLVQIGYDVPYYTITQELDPFSSAYTSTVPASQNIPGTVIIGSPDAISYTTETMYLDNNETPYTRTSQSVVQIGVDVPYFTVTSDLDPFTTPYTSTIQAIGSTPGTVVIGNPITATYYTVTTYLYNGESPFTSSSRDQIFIGVDALTETITDSIDPFSAPYTSTIPASGSVPATVVIGSPGEASYFTTTTYLDNGETPFTSSSRDQIVIGVEAATVTITTLIDPFSPTFTSTQPAVGSTPGTVLIGQPDSISFQTSTTYLDNGEQEFTSTSRDQVLIGVDATTVTITSGIDPFSSGYTSTQPASGSIPGTIIVGSPNPILFYTSTTYLDNGEQPFTSTIRDEVLVGVDAQTVTVTSGIDAFSSPFTSTQLAVDSTPGTVLIGSPSAIVYVTSTTYLDNGETPFTTTSRDQVVIGTQVSTLTTTLTLSAGQSGYTSTVSAIGSIQGTVIFATAADYVMETTYLDETDSPFTSTADGTILLGSPVSTPTITTTLSADSAGYTSTIVRSGNTPGEVIVGTPAQYEIITSYLDQTESGFTSTSGGTIYIGSPVSTPVSTTTISADSAAFTSTFSRSGSLPGVIIVGTPADYQTSTSYLDDPSQTPFTSTIGGTIIIGSVVSTITITTTQPAYAAAFTSTFPGNGSNAGTVLIGSPSQYQTITSYIDDPAEAAFTSTSDGNVIIGTQVSTVTITTTIPAYATAFSSTIPASGDVLGTVIIGSPSDYETTTSYIDDPAQPPFTSTSDGNVIIGTQVSTITIITTIPAYAIAYSSTIPASRDILGTVIIGSPSDYLTTTSFIDDPAQAPFTITSEGNVIIGTQVSTITTTTAIPAYATAFSSTIPARGDVLGTVIIGSPSDYQTTTSYIDDPAQDPFTSTSDGNVIIGTQVGTVTTTTTIPAYATAFSSTIPARGDVLGTVIIGSPSDYQTTTSYIDDPAEAPFTSTLDGNVIIGTQVSTITTTTIIPAYATAFSSTIPASRDILGTVIVGSPSQYQTSTSYIDDPAEAPFTSTTGGVIVIGTQVSTVTITTTIPAYETAFSSTISASGDVLGTVIIGSPSDYQTSTSYIDDPAEAPFTRTTGGVIVIGTQVSTLTTTTTIPAYATAFTSTISASGDVLGTVIVGSPSQYQTSTSYIDDPAEAPFTSTSDGNVIIGTQVQTVTTTTTLPAYAIPYTSTIQASGAILGTVIVGSPSDYQTSTSYIDDPAEAPFTSTTGGLVVIGSQVSTITSTVSLPAYATPYLSTIPASGAVLGTVIIGSPSDYQTSTSYIDDPAEAPFTRTTDGLVVIGSQVSTITSTISLPAYATPYSSTIPASGAVLGTVIIGAPSDYQTITSYIDDPAQAPFTSTSGETIVIGSQVSTISTTTTLPAYSSGFTSVVSASGSVQGTYLVGTPSQYITSTTYLDDPAQTSFVSTDGGLVLIGIQVSTTSITSTLPAYATGFTSVISAIGSTPGTYIVGTPAPYVTSTTFLDDPTQSAFVSTNGGTVIIGSVVSTVTTTITIPAYSSGFTSVVSASGSIPGTYVVGTPSQYVTTTTYLNDPAQSSFVSTDGGLVIVGSVVSTISTTTTLPPYAPSYISTIRAQGSTPGTVIYGQPGQFTTQTSYLYNGEVPYTSTYLGDVVIGVDATTISSTTTLEAGQQGYTTTIPASGSIPATYIVGSPSQFVTTTSYLYRGEAPYTSTSAGNIIIGIDAVTASSTVTLAPGQSGYTSIFSASGSNPGTYIVGSPAQYTTITTYLYHGETPYTSTSSGNIIIGVDAVTITTTVLLAQGQAGYTSIVSASGSLPGSYIVGTPAQYPIRTSYLYQGESPYISTISNTIVIGVDAVTFSTTSTLPPGQTGYTSVISASGSVPGTYIVGTPLQYTTRTSYLYNGEPPYSSTVAGSVIIAIDALTVSTTTTLAPGQAGYTSIISASGSNAGSYIVGTPAPYTTTTSYLYNGQPTYVSTIGGNIIYGVAATTSSRTTTLDPGSAGYTSVVSASGSIPGTYIVGTPAPYTTITSYLYNGQPTYVSTIGGNIIYGIAATTYSQTTTLAPGSAGYTSVISASGSVPGTYIVGTPAPYTTTTSYLYNGQSTYISTIGGNIVYGVAATTYSQTTTLAPGNAGYTSVISASGSIPGTYIVGITAPYTTTTSYLYNGQPTYASTIGGNIIYGVAAITSSRTTTLDPGSAGYTSVISASGSVPGTYIVGTTAPYTISTSYLYSGQAPYTSTSAGYIIYGVQASTTTITSFIGSNAAYASTITASGSVPGTVYVGYSQSYATVTTVGSQATTSTVPPSGTQAGTVYVVTVNQFAQATSIISASGYQPFCSSYLGYTQRYATATKTTTSVSSAINSINGGTTTVFVTPTITSFTTVPSSTTTQVIVITPTVTLLTAVVSTSGVKKRDIPTGDHDCGGCAMRSAEALAKRQALSTPAALATFAATILSSACSAQVTQATSVITVGPTVTATSRTTVPSTGPLATSTSIVAAVTQIITVASGVSTTVTTTTGTTQTTVSTTTVVVAAGAPTGTQTYLQLIRPINPGASYALSDPAPHMTDNYYLPNTREIFVLTGTKQLYSISHDAYYYRQVTKGVVPNSGKLFWSSTATDGETIFSSVYNSTLKYNELKATNPSTGSAYIFCCANVASSDDNTATGFHIYYNTAASGFPSGCIFTQLFLQPINLAT
ncbi:hypothetical protein BP6252_00444 [Coleophoma cylindrospora]|uniref:PA14 domain-containing protein n=1 Tax=Coleophoma cylindrospora TaxID=1849047 RepID=A0A3D8SQ42_9HELO|nr:hypothetical protein BP6252_00444 [Coleophoma cylindrospora]